MEKVVKVNEQNEFASTTIKGQTITIKVEQAETALKEVLDEATSVLSGILSTEGVESVQFGKTNKITISANDDIDVIEAKVKAAAINEGLTRDSLLSDAEKSYDITVVLSGAEQTINYNISVK